MKRLPGIAAVLILIGMASAGRACNIPVFRYALERWRPEVYQAYVFHNGPLTTEQAALVKTLESHGPSSKVVGSKRCRLEPPAFETQTES